MKVLHVLYELKPSGAEVMLKCAAPYWSSHGLSCDILAIGPQIGPFAATLKEAGYDVEHLPNTRNWGFLRRFAAYVRAGGYDIVHQHAEGMSFWYGLAALGAGAKVVRTVHSNFSFTGNLRVRRGVQRRLLAGLGARYVTIGESVCRNERERFGLASTVVANWADLDGLPPPTPAQRAEARSAWGFAEDEIVLLTLGNCAPIKNHGVLIEAMARCADLPQLRYLHVGLEDEAHSERAQVERLGLSDRVVFAGWLPSPRQALYAADLYAMPSLYEGFSIAALEALSAGMPAVLAEAPGLVDLRRIFPDLFYAPPTAEGMESAIRRAVVLDADARRKIAGAYRQIALERFTAERGVDEYATVYAEIAGRQPAGVKKC
jgi:glycosyltransferase involved in cell wall biosynthesis